MSRSWVSGYDGKTVTTPLGFTRYCREQLGCSVPVGSKLRGKWYARLKEEMDIQGWTFDDLVRAVAYVKERNILVKRIDGIFYYVEEANSSDGEELYANVARALAEEDDPWWSRRLSLARGRRLRQVYEEWLEARGKGES